MRCLIVGAGSIGSRRARLLAEMGHEVVLADIDCSVEPPPEASGPYFYDAATALGAARQSGITIDAAFVCTPAATHIEVARECVQAGIKGLFIEKPLSVSMDGIPELIAECEARGVVTMGACNMRWAYRDVPKGPHWEAVLTVAKPLSAWRPGAESYRDGGVVLEAAIHELDLVRWMVGSDAVEVWATGNEDAACIFVDHGGNRESRIYASWAEGEPEQRWCAINAHAAVYKPDTSDEMYRQEMAHFLDHVASGTATTNPIANAAETLGWALKARDMTRTVAA